MPDAIEMVIETGVAHVGSGTDRRVLPFRRRRMVGPFIFADLIGPADLEPGKRGLALFLAQYWGGPATYSAERGHPRLRARHLPFPIDTPERDAWVLHMTAALRAGGLSADDEAEFLAYVDTAATHKVAGSAMLFQNTNSSAPSPLRSANNMS